jgi:hypothetical protein
VTVRVFRIVVSAWLVGWFWKAGYFAPYLFAEIWTYPLAYDGLPGVLVHPAPVSIVWLAPSLALVALAMPRVWAMRATAWLFTACALGACMHLETFWDATYVTSFWSALWLVWFTANASRTDAAFRLHARVLAQCVIGLVFLGGAVGKLTGAYVVGDAVYQLYFLQKSNWPYPWLRETLSPEALHSLAVWFSRGVIVVELALAASPLVPSRIAATGGIVLMLAIVAVSTLYLMSVMACLLGLCAAVLVLSGSDER